MCTVSHLTPEDRLEMWLQWLWLFAIPPSLPQAWSPQWCLCLGPHCHQSSVSSPVPLPRCRLFTMFVVFLVIPCVCLLHAFPENLPITNQSLGVMWSANERAACWGLVCDDHNWQDVPCPSSQFLMSQAARPVRTLTWFNNMTQINAGPAQVRRWTPWIIGRVEHKHSGRSRIHFPLHCGKDKAADKDLKCIPGINIIWSEDTEVLWRVEIIMIICWAGMTRDYCGPGLPELWCLSSNHLWS